MSNDIQFSTRPGRRLAGVKGSLLRGPRKTKRRVSLRVPSVVVGQIRRLSAEVGMAFSGLCEILIQFAAVATFLRLEKQEGVDDFLSSTRLSWGMKILGGHEPRIVTETGGGRVVSLRFPARFLERVSLYAKLTGRTRSDLLLQFLEQGLRIYLRGWVAVTKTLTIAVKASNRGNESHE